jgi:hypothetical protein
MIKLHDADPGPVINDSDPTGYGFTTLLGTTTDAVHRLFSAKYLTYL